MGACQTGPVAGDEVFESAGKGEELLVIPQSEVYIVGKGGEEGKVETGSLKLLSLKDSTDEVKVLYVGPEDQSDSERGFYYPLKPDTAVTFRDGVLACDAGDGDVFGILLPPDMDEATLEVLDELLWGCCAFTSRRKPRTEAERKIAEIERHGEELKKRVKEVEALISQGIKDAGQMADEKLGQHKVALPPAAKQGVKAVKGVTHGTVKVSNKIIGGVVDIAANAAKAAAKGGVVAAKGLMPAQADNNGPSALGETMAVGQAGCMVAVQLIDILFETSDKLYVEAIGETEKVAKDKYGEDVAKVTKDGMKIGKDVFDIYKLTGSGGGKEAAKYAVKKQLASKAFSHTAKGIASGVKEGLVNPPAENPK